MLERNVYLAPSPFETSFLSTAHSSRDVDRTIAAAEGALADLLARA
jgi:glutamate-1-semialdehyde 2,1-aminomutase